MPIFLYMYLYLYFYICICACIFICVFVPVFLYVYFCLYFCIGICVCICTCIWREIRKRRKRGDVEKLAVLQLMELQGSKVLVDWLRPPAHIKVKPGQTTLTSSSQKYRHKHKCKYKFKCKCKVVWLCELYELLLVAIYSNSSNWDSEFLE